MPSQRDRAPTPIDTDPGDDHEPLRQPVPGHDLRRRRRPDHSGDQPELRAVDLRRAVPCRRRLPAGASGWDAGAARLRTHRTDPEDNKTRRRTMSALNFNLSRDLTCGAAAVLITMVLSATFVESTAVAHEARVKAVRHPRA